MLKKNGKCDLDLEIEKIKIINKIIKLVNCRKYIPIINIFNSNIQLDVFIYKQIIKNSNYGPIRYSNYVMSNYIMSALPVNCMDVVKILKKSNNIGLVLSLRENDELYAKCSIIKKIVVNKNPDIKIMLPIFWRFHISDYGVQNVDLIKSLIDNLLTYVKNTNKNVFIHCHSGHGRSGMILCCIFAVQLLKEFILIIKQSKIINKYVGHIFLSYFDQGTFNKYNFNSEAIYTREIATAIFKISQIMVMASLRFHRKTDSETHRKELKQIIVPETLNQEEVSINIIILYINEYITNGFLNVYINDINDDSHDKYINKFGKPLWPMTKNIGLGPSQP
jgi:hypothetical protein